MAGWHQKLESAYYDQQSHLKEEGSLILSGLNEQVIFMLSFYTYLYIHTLFALFTI